MTDFTSDRRKKCSRQSSITARQISSFFNELFLDDGKWILCQRPSRPGRVHLRRTIQNKAFLTKKIFLSFLSLRPPRSTAEINKKVKRSISILICQNVEIRPEVFHWTKSSISRQIPMGTRFFSLLSLHRTIPIRKLPMKVRSPPSRFVRPDLFLFVCWRSFPTDRRFWCLGNQTNHQLERTNDQLVRNFLGQTSRSSSLALCFVSTKKAQRVRLVSSGRRHHDEQHFSHSTSVEIRRRWKSQKQGEIRLNNWKIISLGARQPIVLVQPEEVRYESVCQQIVDLAEQAIPDESNRRTSPSRLLTEQNQVNIRDDVFFYRIEPKRILSSLSNWRRRVDVRRLPIEPIDLSKAIEDNRNFRRCYKWKRIMNNRVRTNESMSPFRSHHWLRKRTQKNYFLRLTRGVV